MRTQVAILGAGPAGLVLARRLARERIDCVVIERRDRAYVEQRVRAGGLEAGTVDLLTELGVGQGVRERGMVHEGTKLRFDGRTHRISFVELTGKRLTVYPQQELVKDMIAVRLAQDGEILFEAESATLHDVESARPSVRFRHAGRSVELSCEVIAGCDGFHGVSRTAMPASMKIYRYDYPFGWLGILAEAPPSDDTAVYAYHQRGFAMATMRSPVLSRHYLQVDLSDPLADWSDDRIWSELTARLATEEDWTLNEGPIVQKAISPLRSFVSDPMQHGQLYLAGDAAHIVPPTGAKGMNLAIGDAWRLGEALVESYGRRSGALLESYTRDCMRQVWRRQEFSIYMTELLHVLSSDQPEFRHRLQLSRLTYVVASEAASRSLAENYVGFDYET
jgi:p-hydroxybenzoate 3-monooxygenase